MKTIRYILLIVLLSGFFTNSFGQQQETRSISATSGGSSISGKYTIYYGYGNNDNKIIKPFVICEGIDPLNNQDADFVYDQINTLDGNNHFLNDLYYRYYDVIVLDLKYNTVDIEKNADLFIDLIKTINAELITNNSKYRLNVLGVSMGGLIIRYALAKMEKQGLDHRVERYISFDSPHLGANIPLGIQQMLDTYLGPLIDVEEWNTVLNKLHMNDFTARLLAFSTGIFGCNLAEFNSNAVNRADFSAAFEMSAVFMHDNIWRQSFLNNLSDVGSFPKKCRSIAVSMGTNKTYQGFDGGASLLNISKNFTLVDYSLELPWDLGPMDFKWTPLGINNDAKAMPGDNLGRTFNTSITTQPLINSDIIQSSFTKHYFEHDNLVVPKNCNLDNVPGSNYSLLEAGLSDYISWLDKNVTIPIDISTKVCPLDAIPFVGDMCQTVGVHFDVTFNASDILGTPTSATDFAFCFVPTISALGINNADWFDDIKNIIPTYPYPNNKSVTPFDAIQFSKYNNYHAYMPNYYIKDDGTYDEDDDVYNFLKTELIPANLYIQNRTFDNSYSNVFEANTITIGNNVDPVANRSSIGNVSSNVGSDITFSVPQNGKITLNPGCSFTSNAHFVTNNTSYQSTTTTLKNYVDKLKNTKVHIDTNKVSNSATILKPISTEKVINKSIVITDGSQESGYISQNVEYQIAKTKIEIYPNPISKEGKVYLEIAKSTKVNIDILSIQGVVIKNIINSTYIPGVYVVNFDTEDLSKGIYFCNISYENTNNTIKLIVE